MAYDYVWIDGYRVEVNVAYWYHQLEAEFRAVWGMDLIVSDGTRTREEQQELYDGWNARLPGYNLAAPPGYSNHEESGPRGPRALDIRDDGPDAGVATVYTPRSLWMRANAPRFHFTNAGYEFDPQEGWHIEFTGEIGIPAPAPTPAPPARVPEEDDTMKLKYWGGHALLIGRETVYHVNDGEWLAYLEDPTNGYGPGKTLDNGALTLELCTNAIPWDAVDACLRGAAMGNDGRHWSRLQAEGIAIRGKLDRGVKTLADVVKTAETITPIGA